jgi:biofilm PGA synthesis N-glycosyltransferase PgaC
MRLAEWFLAFVVLYPVATAAWWMAGGLLYAWLEPSGEVTEPEGGWPGVSILIPAYNEELVIARCVRAALSVDYPRFEVLVLDDGSTDRTAEVAGDAVGNDPRGRVVRDEVNRGKADRLNLGFRAARHELVVVTDADTHLHPQALLRLVHRLSRSSPLVAAVAGAPHVTNRGRLLMAMQVLEAASIIGLIRRTQALAARVGVVAGVLALYRRDRVIEVGGFDPRMATEDIDLTWRLLLAGWETTYEPHALVGMEVPGTLPSLWAQRSRWARGQGEVLNVHLRDAMAPPNRRMWFLAVEAAASLTWVVGLSLSLLIGLVLGALDPTGLFGLSITWGIAVAVLATIQVIVALVLDHGDDPTAARALWLGPLYPIAFWTVNAAAALRHQTVALFRGPRKERVVWDIPREDATP